MNRNLFIITSAMLAVISVSALGAAWEFNRVDRDVWLAIGTNAEIVGGNVGIIATPEGLVLVDTGGTVRATQLLLEQVAREIDQPVRYVINTHFHHDHVGGNAVFSPEVKIVSHRLTREGLERHGREYVSIQRHNAGAQITQLTHRLSLTPNPGEKREIQASIGRLVRYREALGKTTIRLPDITFDSEFRLHLGGMEIVCIWPGKGHSDGNALVHLPEKKLLLTGDYLLDTIPYMGDASLTEWAEGLEKLKPLDFKLILPGHGLPFDNRERIDDLQGYINDLMAEVTELTKRRTTLAEVLTQVELYP
ncbi:MBL fold metallo-hydrolase, partial [candidate division KSB1 bacterium]